MRLRRLHRILSGVIVASLTIAASDGLLCLIPCAASAASASDGRAPGDVAKRGHCATEGAPPARPGSSAQPQTACAGEHAIGEWIGERAVSRPSLDRETADAVDAFLPRPNNTTARVTLRHFTTSASPPGTFVPLRI